MEKTLMRLLLLLLAVSAVFLAGSFIVRDNGADGPQAEVVAEGTGADLALEPAEVSAEPEPETKKDIPAIASDPRIELAEGEKPLLAIIVDDGGNQMDLTKRIAATDLPLTWAILPHTRFASETAGLAQSKGVPYLVHLPMQAQSDRDGSGEYLVGRGLTAEQIRNVTRKALDSLPGAIGINNHRGSLATSSVEIMEPVIYELKERGLIFIDSRTSQKSVAHNVAIVNGVSSLRNQGFLDGSQEKAEIEKRFAEIVKLAAGRGNAIVICHFRPTTTAFLESIAAKKETLPVRLVTIPELIETVKTRSR